MNSLNPSIWENPNGRIINFSIILMDSLAVTIKYLCNHVYRYVLILPVIILGLQVPPTPAQSDSQSVALTVQDGSRLWIEGTTTIADYTCKAKEIEGKGLVEETQPTQLASTDPTDVQVSIMVRNLNCGKPGMNRDMYDALKAEKHPNIKFKLLEASLKGGKMSRDSTNVPIYVKGILEIAGRQQTIEMVVQGGVLDTNTYKLKGKKALNMLDYDITPPTAFYGLIKADEKLTVHFDLVVAPVEKRISELSN